VGNRKIIEDYSVDISNLTEVLTKAVASYRLLVGAAGEYNTIALATKSEVKHALKRADKLGEVVDDLIDVLDDVVDGYENYCKLKAKIITGKMEDQYILTEIDNELKLQNSELRLQNSEIKLKDNEIKLKDNEIKLKDTEIKLKDNEIKLRDNKK
jgi:hypothetical protein